MVLKKLYRYRKIVFIEKSLHMDTITFYECAGGGGGGVDKGDMLPDYTK